MKRLLASTLMAAGLMLGLVASAGPAAAAPVPASAHVATTGDCYPNCSPGTGAHHSSGVKPSAAPSSASHTTSSASALAFTGADVAATTGIALALLLGGLVLVRVTRRRTIG